MRSTSELRRLWHPPCRIRKATFVFWTGVRVTIDSRTLELWKAIDQIFRAWGYAPKAGQTWGYACRVITGGSGYSLHAYGIAVDINSLANPYGRRLITDMPRPMVEAILRIRLKGGFIVVRWGGYYLGNKDAMHYEDVASPAEMLRGIDWNTVYGSPPPSQIKGDDLLGLVTTTNTDGTPAGIFLCVNLSALMWCSPPQLDGFVRPHMREHGYTEAQVQRVEHIPRVEFDRMAKIGADGPGWPK